MKDTLWDSVGSVKGQFIAKDLLRPQVLGFCFVGGFGHAPQHVSWPGMAPATSALEAWSLNHGTAKEVPEFFVLIQIFDPFYTQSTSDQWWIESVNQLKYVSRGVDKRMI